MNYDDLPVAPPIHLLNSETRVAVAEPEGGQVDVEQLRCQWCSGFHVTNCWAIQEVEFFPDGRWAKIKLADRPEAKANTVYDPDEFINGLVSNTED